MATKTQELVQDVPPAHMTRTFQPYPTFRPYILTPINNFLHNH